MEAASGGYADIVRLLIDHGADVNAKSAAGWSLITLNLICSYLYFIVIIFNCVFGVIHEISSFM